MYIYIYIHIYIYKCIYTYQFLFVNLTDFLFHWYWVKISHEQVAKSRTIQIKLICAYPQHTRQSVKCIQFVGCNDDIDIHHCKYNRYFERLDVTEHAIHKMKIHHDDKRVSLICNICIYFIWYVIYIYLWNTYYFLPVHYRSSSQFVIY